MACLFQHFYKSFVTMVILFVQINRSSCQTYDGSNQGHTSVPGDIPSGRTAITLNNNEISHVDDESFNETFTDFSTVYSLYLYRNKIENVSERAFMGFQNVRYISLYFNQLKHIAFMVEDIPRLETLILKNNLLSHVPKFHGFFPSLTRLHIAGNFISHVCEEDFENITNIRYLYLGRNSLITFEPKQELLYLYNLELGRNKLTEIPMLKGTYSSLGGIDIRYNKLTVESLLALKERINGSEQSLTQLYFSGNEDLATNLSVVVNFLKTFPKLRKLGIIDSKINKIFHLTNSLETLILNENEISGITKEDFNVTNEYNAFKLYLRGNPMQSLPNLYEYLKDFNSKKNMIYVTRIKFHCENLCWMTERG